MYSVNPYQPASADHRPRRRSFVVILSAGIGAIVALVVLNTVVRPSPAAPIIEVELAPSAVGDIDGGTTTIPVAAVPISTAPATTALPISSAPATTALATTVPATTVPASRPSAPLRWFPPDTPDFVRAQVHDDENLDVVAPFAGGTMAYFAVTTRASAACAGAVYRVEQGAERELVRSSSYLYARGDGRWVVLSANQGVDCRPTTLTIVDTLNGTTRDVAATGWFSLWSPAAPRFVLFDYLAVQFTLYDGPSATSQRLSVAAPFAAELDQRTGARGDQLGWRMGRVAFLADGELVAHIQCQTDACAKKDTISGWFSVVDGQVIGESGRLPADKAPSVGFCGL